MATLPRTDITGNLAHDTTLVKAALLYADRVTLASPNALMLAGIAGLATPDSDARRDAVMQMATSLSDNDDAQRLYNDLKRRRRKLNERERIALRQLEKHLRASGDEVAQRIDEILEQAGAGELDVALREGVVDIHPLGLEEARPEDFSDVIINGLVQVLTEMVSATARTYPMFDDGAGGLVSSMVAEGRIAEARNTRSNEIGAAGQLIGQLEAFPSAPMDVVLDVRRQLRLPLVRFRAALAKLTSDIETSAWDREKFAVEVEDLYRKHVAPALADLEEALEQLGALSTLRRIASDTKTLTASSGLALAVAGTVDLAHLPHAVFGVGPATSLIAAGAAELAKRSEIRLEWNRNEFYFLYEASRKLRR